MFGGRVEDWPGLLRSLMSVTSALMLLAAVAALIVARRREGGLHILRAVVGVLGVVVALIPFQNEMAPPPPVGPAVQPARGRPAAGGRPCR